MNLLKKLWNWFTTPNTDDCCDAAVCEEVTPVEIEEEQIDVRKVFEHYCRSKGVKQADLDSVNAGSLFEEWYDGERTEDAVRASIQDFKQAMGGGVNAKLNTLP